MLAASALIICLNCGRLRQWQRGPVDADGTDGTEPDISRLKHGEFQSEPARRDLHDHCVQRGRVCGNQRACNCAMDRGDRYRPSNGIYDHLSLRDGLDVYA